MCIISRYKSDFDDLRLVDESRCDEVTSRTPESSDLADAELQKIVCETRETEEDPFRLDVEVEVDLVRE
jgi:hypothetical protein